MIIDNFFTNVDNLIKYSHYSQASLVQLRTSHEVKHVNARLVEVPDSLKFVFWERFNGKLYPPRMPSTTAFKGHFIFAILFSLTILTACTMRSAGGSYTYKADSVEVASIRFSKNLYKYVHVALVKKNTIHDDQLSLLKITDSAPRSWIGRFPPSVIEKEIILKFYIKNSSDS